MLGCIVVAAFAVTCPVLAQSTSASEPKPTPQQIAAARAEADAIIKTADAADVFENITDSNLPTVRHRLSGAVCGFEPGKSLNQIHIFSGPPRGDDVSCETQMMDIEQSLIITRWKQRFNTDQALGIAVMAIKKRWPEAQPWVGQVVTMKSDDASLPEYKTARFSIQLDGRPTFTRATVSTVGEWSVLQRTTAPASAAMASDLVAETSMTTTLDKMVHPKAH